MKLGSSSLESYRLSLLSSGSVGEFELPLNRSILDELNRRDTNGRGVATCRNIDSRKVKRRQEVDGGICGRGLCALSRCANIKTYGFTCMRGSGTS